MKKEYIYIYGRNPVMEALQYKPKSVKEVFMPGASKDAHLGSMVQLLGVKRSLLNTRALPGGLHKTVVHQGVVAKIDSDYLIVSYKDFIQKLSIGSGTALLVFGEVQDPQNVGAAIRSAAAFGVSGVLVPPHNQAPINGTVIKVSAGTAFRVPLVSISNVNTALRDLKKRGFWVYGLDGRSETALHEESFPKPACFVLGNEATGLRPKTRETCDTLIRIPISERAESLNAAASAAALLHTWSTKHPEALSE